MDYYIFRSNDLLVRKDSHALPDEKAWRALRESNAVCDMFSETPYAYTAALLQDGAVDENYELIPIRSYFAEHEEKGDKLILAKHRFRNQNIHTYIAGFIEIGESAEQAVVREVREEVGIEIKDLRYVGSQGWPFPDQLMLGFRAEYKSGDIRVQESELVEAKWFTKDALPPFPKRGSMGRRLITGVYG